MLPDSRGNEAGDRHKPQELGGRRVDGDWSARGSKGGTKVIHAACTSADMGYQLPFALDVAGQAAICRRSMTDDTIAETAATVSKLAARH